MWRRRIVRRMMVGGCLCVGLVSHTTSDAWEGQADNRPQDELSQMTESELCTEAFDVCIVGVIWGKDFPEKSHEGKAYLKTIKRVAAREIPGAKLDWADEFYRAVVVRNRHACHKTYAFCLDQ